MPDVTRNTNEIVNHHVKKSFITKFTFLLTRFILFILSYILIVPIVYAHSQVEYLSAISLTSIHANRASNAWEYCQKPSKCINKNAHMFFSMKQISTQSLQGQVTTILCTRQDQYLLWLIFLTS